MGAQERDVLDDGFAGRCAQIAQLQLHYCIDPPTARRLLFLRWLVATGRLLEDAEASDGRLGGRPPHQPEALPLTCR